MSHLLDSLDVLVAYIVNMYCTVDWHHRRKMELEDKANVVASVWGAKFVQFLAALAVLLWSI